MDVVSTDIQQHMGLVVPVDGYPDTDNAHRPVVPYQVSLKVPAGSQQHPASSPSRRMSTSGSQHKLLIGGSDEHHILTTPLGQRAAQNAALASKPNISAIMNEYVGACFEENCNIGKSLWINEGKWKTPYPKEKQITGRSLIILF